MKKDRVKYLVLIFGLLLLGVSYLYFETQSVSYEETSTDRLALKAKKINTKLDFEVKKIRADVHYILDEIDSPNIFKLSNHVYESSAPFYVLKNNELIYWSNQKIAFDSDVYSGDFLWKVISGKFGVYLLYKRNKTVNNDFFEVIYALPLYVKYQIENNYLKSHFNQDVFLNNEVEISTQPEKKWYNLTIDDRTFAISIKFLSTQKVAVDVPYSWLFLAVLGILLCVFFVISQSFRLYKKNQHVLSFLVLLVSLVSIRALMLYIEFPAKYISSDLFDPKYFAYSSIFPSIGDLVLNIATLVIIVFCFCVVFPKTVFYKRILDYPISFRIVVSLFLVILSYALVIAFYNALEGIYYNSQWDYDITKKISFTGFEYLYLLTFISFVILYFLLNRLILSFLFKINSTSHTKVWVLFFIGGIISIVVNEFTFQITTFILIINTIYILIVYFQGLFISFQRFRYGAYVYLIITSISCAAIGAVAVFKNSQYRELINKERFANQLIFHHDYQGEFLLGELSEEIEDDAFIKDIMTKPFSSKNLIFQKIKRSYISNYFDKYETNILIFDVNFSPYYRNQLPGNFYDLYTRYNKPEYKTEVNKLFFVNNYKEDNESKYFKFITLKKNNVRIGYLVLNLTLKKVNPNSVYPILLQNKKYISPVLKNTYNYAVYDGEQLLYSSGEVNYDEQIFKKTQEVFSKKELDFYFRKYHHYTFKGIHDKRVIVSSKDDRFKIYNTNFSFLFLTSIFFIFFVMLIITLIPSSRRTITNYSTKIHLYLNLAYLVPLIVVSITTLSIINSTYENDLEISFQSKAESIGANLINYLEQYEKNEISEEDFQSSIQRLTKYSESDINLFDVKGMLKMTTQPLIYEAKLVSKQLNPNAMVNIFETKHKMVLLDEMIGDFKFKSVYVSLILQDTGEMLGIMSIPFYNSKYELNDKKIAVFSSIMNIFTVAFILILILSYFASKNLTHPLRLISQKLKKTTLGGDNEKLEWNTRDEIGILVHEYNEMIEKLEDSRNALARKEKESAWKEMAQQVAHEIKNPLTPMKLKIQHLQRTIKTDDLTQEALKSLLQQVDTLSDIATSFSAFAKMPIPIIEEFNLTQLVHDTGELYRNREDVDIKIKIPVSPVMAFADKQLIGRIFTNLILNSIQAVPKDVKAEILIEMYVNEIKEAVLTFKDNGEGIPEDIQNKIFLPNFSTKFTGSGIGLALAKRGVEHSGGRIWFESELGKGTTFYIILPMYNKVLEENWD